MQDTIHKLLDETGRRILAELEADARISYADLARRVNLSAPAVAERMRRLEEAGIITGYHARTDPNRLGLAIVAFVSLQTPSHHYPAVITLARNHPHVSACHHVTGDSAFLLKVQVASTAALEALIADFSRFGATSTALILSSPVEKP